jgi:pimeloyl-ACP methyl ester carboxylesterase
MFPATISELENWLMMVALMAQKYTVYFFELPGHGKSTAFKQHFSSDLVADTVMDFIKALKIKKPSILGFSFGGIMALKMADKYRTKIDRVILLGPFVNKDSIMLPKYKLAPFKLFFRFTKSKPGSYLMHLITRSEPRVRKIVSFFIKLGRLEEHTAPSLRRKILAFNQKSFEVLSLQLLEALNFQFTRTGNMFDNQAVLGMSINDPLVNYQVTEKTIKQNFSNLTVHTLKLKYHQFPKEMGVRHFYKRFGRFIHTI